MTQYEIDEQTRDFEDFTTNRKITQKKCERLIEIIKYKLEINHMAMAIFIEGAIESGYFNSIEYKDKFKILVRQYKSLTRHLKTAYKIWMRK